MTNCIILQSGGPTAVVNATAAGIIRANQLNPVYEHVYGGLNGLVGMLADRLIDLTDMSEEENRILSQTPSSALGSCRFKLRRNNLGDIKKVIALMDRYEAETFFYIGGKDAMGSIAALNSYARENDLPHRFIGCLKTIDNDVVGTDHCPGYGSAAKFIASTALQCWLDLNVYPASRKEVFVMETMGKHAGWLAASSCLSGIVDVLIVPEIPFDKDAVMDRIRRCISEKNKCFVAVSEGAAYADGTPLAKENDGAAKVLQQMILEEWASPRCKVLDLSTSQRCHVTDRSLTDVTEATMTGMCAHMRSVDPSFSGRMICIGRKEDSKEYEAYYFAEDAGVTEAAVKTFPREWLLDDYAGVSEEALAYMRPLIQGTPQLIMKDGLPAYIRPYYLPED